MVARPDANSNGMATDEPGWSPALQQLMDECGQVWFCCDQDDADLLLRPDAGDFPAVCLAVQDIPRLTPDMCQALSRIYVLQRHEDALDEGWYRRYGQRVKQQLEAIAWQGTLYRIPLNEIIPTLPRLWAFVQEDRQRFQAELMHFQTAIIGETIKPGRRPRPVKAKGPRPIIVHADQVGGRQGFGSKTHRGITVNRMAPYPHAVHYTTGW